MDSRPHIVIVGGGFGGLFAARALARAPARVELAGAIEEIAKGTLRGDFRNFDPASTRVVLIDAAPRALGAFSPHLAERAAAILRSRGVELRLSTQVEGIDAAGLDLSDGRPAGR